MRLSAAGLAGSAAHPPLRGRPQTRRRIRAVHHQSRGIERSSPRSGRTRTAPLHGATPPDGVRAQLCASAHPARREARVPAGQNKNAAPSRSAAGKSATLKTPAPLPALPIVTRRAKTTGLVRAANRAGCRQAASNRFSPNYLDDTSVRYSEREESRIARRRRQGLHGSRNAKQSSGSGRPLTGQRPPPHSRNYLRVQRKEGRPSHAKGAAFSRFCPRTITVQCLCARVMPL